MVEAEDCREREAEGGKSGRHEGGREKEGGQGDEGGGARAREVGAGGGRWRRGGSAAAGAPPRERLAPR
jgi:hypothetical protein